jgi:hypothetical protein
VSQTGDWHASGPEAVAVAYDEAVPAASPRAKVSSSKPWPSAASITSDQTHGGWIPPHEPSASWRSRTQRSATPIARRRNGVEARAPAPSGLARRSR